MTALLRRRRVPAPLPPFYERFLAGRPLAVPASD